jgi:hypothetical protein
LIFSHIGEVGGGNLHRRRRKTVVTVQEVKARQLRMAGVVTSELPVLGAVLIHQDEREVSVEEPVLLHPRCLLEEVGDFLFTHEGEKQLSTVVVGVDDSHFASDSSASRA